MLGYPTVFIGCMLRVNRYPYGRALSALCRLLFLAALFIVLACATARVASAQQGRLRSAKGGVANLEAKTQSRKGDVVTADGDVDIHYGDTRLRADHVEYDSKTYEATATGHVQLDYGNEHLEAGEAHYNVSTGHGLFHNVRGTVKIERRPNPAILISDNPLYFEARDVERFPGEVYLVHNSLPRTRESVSIKPSRSLTPTSVFSAFRSSGSLTPRHRQARKSEKPGF
jgi:lipopolysaccharide assembly outer membrane protein LptD (OstA)